MKKLLTIIPFYFFTSLAYGQSVLKIDTLYVKFIYVNGLVYFNGYKLTGVTNLYNDASTKNNNTLAVWSGVDWLGANHPFVLQMRSDLDKVLSTGSDPKIKADLNTVMAENAKLKIDMAILKAAVAAHSDAINAHDSAIVKLQTDSTEMQITNIGTIAKPNWKIITVKPK